MGGSLAEYMTEYKENAFLETYEIDAAIPRDVTGTPCIEADGTITLFLRNPMKYEIGFEYVFNTASLQLLYNTQFMATDPIVFKKLSDDNSIYSMTFPAAFLEAVDSGTVFNSNLSAKDISGTLNAFEKETCRPFGSLDLTLSANSRPMPVCNGIMQLDRDPSENDPLYILCFEIPHSARNNDLTKIQINNSTWQIEYDASGAIIPNIINITPFGGNRGKLISRQYPSDNPDNPDAGIIKTYPLEVGSNDYFEPSNPESFDTFYYITNDPQTDTETLYQITITDKAGLSTTCTLSNKAEKLAQPSITIQQTPAFGPVYIAGWNNTLPVTIMPARQTTTNHPVANTYIEYLVECVDGNGNSLYPDDIPEWKTLRDADTLPLPVNSEDEQYYKITARTKGSGFLASDKTVSSVFKVIRSNHFFVAHSFEGTDDYNDGTLSSPYYSFKKCMEEIDKYQSYLKEKYNFTLEDGFYIDVPENYTVTGSDDVFNRSYLINNKIDDSTTFSGKLTIQGVDDKGNPLSGTSKRTIDAGSSGGLLSWSAVANNTATLSLKNLTFTNGYSKESGKYAGLYFQTISVPGNPDNNNEKLHVTITNCDITHMTGSYGYGIYFYGGNSSLSDTSTSTVTITDCTISDNEKAGINHSYAAQGSSYEKLILAGNTKIQNNSDGGVSESLGLIIQSKNVIISNNKGYGVSAGAWAKIEIAGATIIDNTDASGNAKNLYLVESTSNSGVVSRANITVTGDLSGSSIGVTTAKQPAVGEPVPFVDGWQASYGQPANFFTSDKGCGITTDGSGTPVLAVNSGTGGYHFTEDVTISVSSDNYIPGVEKQITVSASLDGSEPVDITNDVTSWHLELTENGETIPTSWYSVSGRTLTLKQALPRNTYTLYIDIVYNGRHYSDSIAITPPPSVASLTAAPTGGTVTASTASDFAQLASWTKSGSKLANVTILLDSDITLPDDFPVLEEFRGTFDGNGHTIDIGSRTYTSGLHFGLFGQVSGGTVKNLRTTGSITVQATGETRAGGITGDIYSGGTVENCINEVSITGAQFAGGITGYCSSGTIRNCINNADISGTKLTGGILGGKNGSGGDNTPRFYNCVNNGTITTTAIKDENHYCGGIAGYISTGWYIELHNTANTGTVLFTNGTDDTSDDVKASEVFGGKVSVITALENVIYKQGSGSGTFSYDGTQYSASAFAAEIHAKTALSAIVSSLNSWITSQPADERGTYKKWKVSADGTKIVFEDEE